MPDAPLPSAEVAELVARLRTERGNDSPSFADCALAALLARSGPLSKPG